MFYSLQKPNTLFLCCSSSVVVCKSVHGLLRLGKCVPDFMPEMVFLAQKWRRLYVFLLACRDINGVVIYAIGVRNALGTGSASRTHTCQLSNQIRPHCKTSFHLFWPMFCLLLSCLPWRHVGHPRFWGKGVSYSLLSSCSGLVRPPLTTSYPSKRSLYTQEWPQSYRFLKQRSMPLRMHSMSSGDMLLQFTLYWFGTGSFVSVTNIA